jgi:hypothetical protein
VTGCRATPDGLNEKIKQTKQKNEYQMSTKVNPDELDPKPQKKRKHPK